MRVLGRRVGIGVVAADISKGMLAAFLGRPGPRPTGALPRASLATTAVIASRALLSLRRREPVAPTPNRAVS
jgi:glycerol-3-phosphate acyltransferase PlsY